MPRPDARILQNQHETAAEAQAYVARNIPEFLRRSRFSARDGYPARSMGGDGGGTDVGRPTEQAAIAEPVHDPSGDDIKEIVRIGEEIWKLSQRAGNLTARMLGAQEAKVLRLDEGGECVNPNCGKSLVTEGPNGGGTAGRCDACYAYRNRTVDLTDRPLELIEKERAREAKRAKEYVS